MSVKSILLGLGCIAALAEGSVMQRAPKNGFPPKGPGGFGGFGGFGGKKGTSATAVAVSATAGTAAVSSVAASSAAAAVGAGSGKNTGGRGGGKGNRASASSSAAAAATSAASGSTTNGGAASGSTCLDADAVQTGSFFTGQLNDVPSGGQSNSATDKANFINFCSGSTLTNGLQIKSGSCNGIVMGKIPATTNMVSTVILNPKLNDNLPANTSFNITLSVANLNLGTFTNATDTYYAAPQDIGAGGDIVGHTHVTVQNVGSSFQFTTPLDATQFVFFKGINDAGNGKGTVTTAVTGGLPAGNYRVCSMSSASNHQPVLMPVAQRGAQDDCRYFSVSDNGGGAAGGAGGAGSGTTNNAASGDSAGSSGGSSVTSSVTSSATTSAGNSGSNAGGSAVGGKTGKGSKAGKGTGKGSKAGQGGSAGSAGSGATAGSTGSTAGSGSGSAAGSGSGSAAGSGSGSGAVAVGGSSSSTDSCSTAVSTTFVGGGKAAATAASVASASTAAAAASTAASSAGALGGIAAPAVTDSGDAKRPFEVNGATFVNKSAAVQRACAIQNNACANAVNSGKLPGKTVGDCNAQETTCNAQ